MKRISVILLIALSLSGCAFLQARKADWQACKADAACVAEAGKWQQTGELVGGIAGSAFPGAAMPAQKVAGYLALAIAILIGGHAINKKKGTPPA